MLKDKTIAVVMPAYNEEKLVQKAIDSVPSFVDRIIVIDDCSKDQTWRKILESQAKSDRLLPLRHDKNRGVGAAIATGYRWCRDHGMDVAVVMAGDAQMDPADLPRLLAPVLEDRADYSKGNRLFTGEAYKVIPRVRYFGNAALSLLTKVASGYWHVADSQSGYTAISKKALHAVDWDRMYKRYGQPNDLLVRLNVENMRVADIPVRPVYNIGEESGIRLHRILITLPCLLLRMFLWRLKEKYVIRDFHPLVFFYLLAFLLLFLCLPLTARLYVTFLHFGELPKVNLLAIMFCGIMGLQSLFFAMLFDMESNKDLR